MTREPIRTAESLSGMDMDQSPEQQRADPGAFHSQPLSDILALQQEMEAEKEITRHKRIAVFVVGLLLAVAALIVGVWL